MNKVKTLTHYWDEGSEITLIIMGFEKKGKILHMNTKEEWDGSETLLINKNDPEVIFELESEAKQKKIVRVQTSDIGAIIIDYIEEETEW